MTYEATFMLYGYKAVPIGQFESKELAAQAIIDHIIENSGIHRPRVVATMKIRSKEIRIDYGSKTCYYLITLIKKKRRKNKMSNSIDYKQGYRDAIQFAISEINESADNFLIDEKEADRINENLKTILRKVYQND